MSDDDFTGSSGSDNPYQIEREKRKITLALGIEAQPDMVYDPLKEMIGDDFEVSGDVATYSNDHLGVDYEITRVFGRQDYKDALETTGICVVYMGHARYGRGACFARDHNFDPGDSWETGTDDPDNPYLYPVDGIFRLGYPYVPVELDDVEHHRYHFAPVPAEEDPPPNAERHPDARRSLSRITLPEDYRDLVLPDYRSDSNRYWGYTGGKTNLLFHAGWTGSAADPLDLGATQLRCRCFCHFGCSSRLHFREILRGEGYKAWQRNDPPTDQFAYFTTATSNSRGTILWLYHWLTCNLEIDDSSWWESLKYAVTKANARLRQERLGYLIY